MGCVDFQGWAWKAGRMSGRALLAPNSNAGHDAGTAEVEQDGMFRRSSTKAPAGRRRETIRDAISLSVLFPRCPCRGGATRTCTAHARTLRRPRPSSEFLFLAWQGWAQQSMPAMPDRAVTGCTTCTPRWPRPGFKVWLQAGSAPPRLPCPGCTMR